MKKILLLLILVLFASSHTCQYNPPQATKDRTMISYDDTLNRAKLNNLIISDSLSFEIDDWISSFALSEDREPIYKYVFIKSLTDSTGIIYTLSSYQDTLYIINKRVIE